MITNPAVSARNRHFAMRMWWLRDVVEKGQVSVQYVPTEKQLVDILTKVPPKTIKHKRARRPYKKGCFLRIPKEIKDLWKKKRNLSAAREYKYAMTQALKASELGRS